MELWKKQSQLQRTEHSNPYTMPALQQLQGTERPIINTVSALQQRGFSVPISGGYLDPQQDEIVSIVYDGIWSHVKDESMWLYVKDGAGKKGWIHRCMVLPPPA